MKADVSREGEHLAVVSRRTCLRHFRGRRFLQPGALTECQPSVPSFKGEIKMQKHYQINKYMNKPTKTTVFKTWGPPAESPSEQLRLPGTLWRSGGSAMWASRPGGLPWPASAGPAPAGAGSTACLAWMSPPTLWSWFYISSFLFFYVLNWFKANVKAAQREYRFSAESLRVAAQLRVSGCSPLWAKGASGDARGRILKLIIYWFIDLRGFQPGRFDKETWRFSESN